MSKSVLSAVLIAAIGAGLGACAGGGEPSSAIERRYDDAVVRTRVDTDHDMVAEVFTADRAPVARLDWTSDAGGAFAAGDRSYAVEFDRATLSPEQVSDLAHALWQGTTSGQGPAGVAPSIGPRLCVGGPGWECCLQFPEIFVCKSYY